MQRVFSKLFFEGQVVANTYVVAVAPAAGFVAVVKSVLVVSSYVGTNNCYLVAADNVHGIYHWPLAAGGSDHLETTQTVPSGSTMSVFCDQTFAWFRVSGYLLAD